MSRKARRVKPGSYLAPVKTEKLLEGTEDLAVLDRQLRDAGYRRSETTRPYLTKRGILSFRFVWRRRRDGATSVYQHVVRFPVSDILSQP